MNKFAIIGGGFYGTCLAIYLHECGIDVRIFEKEKAIMQRASTNNQARIHMGYHYPRNFQTAYSSFVNFPRFVTDFNEAVVDDFTKLYAIAKIGSKTSAGQFYTTFKRMKAEIKPAASKYRSLFSTDLIEDIFEVKEFAFDSKVLQVMLQRKLISKGIKTVLGAEISSIETRKEGGFWLHDVGGEKLCQADIVFNCTYSRINNLRNKSQLPSLPLKHEITEIALIEVPEILKNIGATVMDGPYFSVMPYPSRGLHSFSHVRYTPHRRWVDTPHHLTDGDQLLEETRRDSNFPFMVKDAKRYMPILSEINKRDSIYEIKTILIQNELNDGRPILFHEEPSIPGCYTIMGGKIDNIYDILEVIMEARQKLCLKEVSINGLFRID